MVIINNTEKISGRFFDSASHKIDYIVYSFRKDNPPALKLTNTGEDSKLVHRRIWPKVDALFSSFFATRPSMTQRRMTQRRVENIRVHFWTFSPVSVNRKKKH